MGERNLKRALIIGGSGGLSSVVARTAMERGYAVWALTRGNKPLPAGVHPLVADRNDRAAAERAILGAEGRMIDAEREMLGAERDETPKVNNEQQGSSGTGIDVTRNSEKSPHWDVVFDCICMNREQAEWDVAFLPRVTDRLVVVSTDSVYDPLHKRTPQNEDGVFISEEGTTAEVSYGCNKRRMEEAFEAEMERQRHAEKCAGAASGANGLQITIFRPGHIYGPGFMLGCFPENSRLADLPEKILREEPIRLVGLGTYLIHPIYVDDLARVMVDCAENAKTYGQIFCIGGPEAVENREYYACIARALGVELHLEEVPLQGYLEAHPEYSGHLCHRIYDLSKLADAGIRLPDTHLQDGICKVLQTKWNNMVKM